MKNPYQPTIAIIKKVQAQTPEVMLFTLRFKNKKDQLQFTPGQFVEISIPGFGEAPFALCSRSNESDFQVCIRKTGGLTSQLFKRKTGDFVYFRGPYGNGFPQIKNKNLLLIGGGLGIIPLRSLILSQTRKQTEKIQVFYGACDVGDLLFQSEYKIWEKNVDLHVALEQASTQLKCHIGLVTNLFENIKVIKDAMAFVCGPPIMYRFVLQKLKQAGFSNTDIFLSLERRMHCGIGTCQHCAIGSYYVCKHGPIFRWKDIKNIPSVI